MSAENIEKGKKLRRSLLPAQVSEQVDAAIASGEGMKRFGDYVYDAVLGNLWHRDGLDLKTRTLITVITDVAMGVEEELAIHLRMAMNQGWTSTQLAEAILHAGGYCGIPRARRAMLTLDRVSDAGA